MEGVMSGTNFGNRILNDDSFIQQVEVRSGLTATELYQGGSASTGTVAIDVTAIVGGADSVYIITAGDCDACTLTAKFHLFGKQIGADVSISVPAQTDDKVHYTEVSFSDLPFADSVSVSGTVTEGDFKMALGKQGLG